MGLRDFTLFDIVERNARLYPDRLAFALDGERVTHAAYRARAERLAAGLARAGVRPGDRVGRGLAEQPGICRSLRRGRPARRHPGAGQLALERRRSRLCRRRCGAKNRDCRRRQSAVAASGARSSLPMVEHWYGIGANAGSLRALCRLARRRRDKTALPAPHSDADAGLVMIHTAAVGGRPRGALLSHANLIAASAQLCTIGRSRADDVNLGVLPLFHVAGLGMLLAAQYAGGASIIRAEIRCRVRRWTPFTASGSRCSRNSRRS